MSMSTSATPNGPNHNTPGIEENKKTVLLDGLFEYTNCSNNKYRVILTQTELFLQSIKNSDIYESYSFSDLFGIQTYRKEVGAASGSKHFGSLCLNNNSIVVQNSTSITQAAYLCFCFYPKSKQGKFRERTYIIIRYWKEGNCFENNLDYVTLWKTLVLEKLRTTHFSKWQLKKLNTPTPINQFDHNAGDIEPDLGKIEGMHQQLHDLSVSINSSQLFLRRFLVILNPKSGQGKTLMLFKETVYPIFCESGIKSMLLITEKPGHARSLISKADLKDIHGIVTVGGDGLLYEVVNGLRSRPDAQKFTDIPVGVIAGGSGNGLARSIASYSAESEDYLHNPVLESTLAVARGRVLAVNLAQVQVDSKRVYAFLSVGWGILADIDIESEVIRPIGECRFVLWSFLRIAKLRTYSANLSFSPVGSQESKVSIDGEFISVYASVQSHIGSDITFAPSATPNDGLIHLTYIRGDVGRARITQFLLGLDTGKHIEVPGVTYVPVSEFTISSPGGIEGTVTLDGEQVNGQSIRVSLAPNSLNVFAL